jgi:uncharacterized membrane protein YphA (DoxX/SURF4 family)
MKRLSACVLNPPDSAPKATILLRLMAGGVFLWEAILKFVYTNQGVGRFTKIGIPAPHATAAFVDSASSSVERTVSQIWRRRRCSR